MYTKIHRGAANNKGSSKDLMQYLSKEDKVKLDYVSDDKLAEIKNFYDKDNNELNVFEAQQKIDDHSKGLKKDETKFFMLTINPSNKELEHLKLLSENEANKTGQDKNEIYENKLKDFTKIVMDNYAKNFNRELNGNPLSVDNLNYVARIETERTYKYTDEAVKYNKEVDKTKTGEYLKNSENKIIREGIRKEGNNEHIHVIVSRYDMTKKMTLSPNSNSKGNSENHTLNGNKVQVGFDRNQFSINCEKSFDKEFGFERNKEYSVESKLNNSNQKIVDDLFKNNNSIIDNKGNVDVLELSERVGEIVANLLTNPAQVAQNIAESMKDQLKTIVIPEVDKNPILEAQKQLDLKAKVKEQIKSAITSGGLEMD